MVICRVVLCGRVLSVKYAPDVPTALAEVLEHHARNEGLSLGALEIIGSSLDFVESFIVAAEEQRATAWLEEAGLVAPADPVARARWQAEKLFGVEFAS